MDLYIYFHEIITWLIVLLIINQIVKIENCKKHNEQCCTDVHSLEVFLGFIAFIAGRLMPLGLIIFPPLLLISLIITGFFIYKSSINREKIIALRFSFLKTIQPEQSKP